MILDRAGEHIDAERFSGEADDRGAEFESLSIEAGLAKHGDESAVGGADFEDFCRRELEFEKRAEPMEAAFVKIGAGPGGDIGAAEVGRLVFEPVIAAVIVAGVVGYAGVAHLLWAICDECVAAWTGAISFAEGFEVGVAAPALHGGDIDRG